MEVYSILSLLLSSNDHAGLLSFDHKYERLHEFVFEDFEENESYWCSELDTLAAVESGSVSDDSAENKVTKTARPD